MKRSAWILLVLLILAVGIYYLIDILQDKRTLSETEPPVEPAEYLVVEPEAVLTTIRLFDQSLNILVLSRNEEAIWEILVPRFDFADQTKVSALETQVDSLMAISTIGWVSNLDDFGLTLPAITIKLEYSNSRAHQIAVGKSTPTNSGYYVQVDHGQVLVVSQISLDAITDLLTMPPYQPTTTPTVTLEQPTASTPLSAATQTPEKPTP